MKSLTLSYQSHPLGVSHPSRVRGLKSAGKWRLRFSGRSHPSRVRGLKSGIVYVGQVANFVAPFTGAWIEISTALEPMMTRLTVAPFTGAWIEIPFRFVRSRKNGVAPFTGAWIEICFIYACRSVVGGVAPFTGAWIEIHKPAPNGGRPWPSHPSRVRGLK